MGNQRRRYPADKPYFRKIDWVFYHEREIRQAVQDERCRQAGRPLTRDKYKLTDPTARDALELIDPTPLKAVAIEMKLLRWPERWLEVVDMTYDYCRKWDWFELVRRYYDGQTYIKITMECHISQNVLYNVLNSAKTYAALMAVQLIPEFGHAVTNLTEEDSSW